jgi:hypothetical protein
MACFSRLALILLAGCVADAQKVAIKQLDPTVPLPLTYDVPGLTYAPGMELRMNSAEWNSGYNFSLGIIENFRSQVLIPSTANPPRSPNAPYHSADFASGMSSHVVSLSGAMSAVGGLSRAWIQVYDSTSPGIGHGTLSTVMTTSTMTITVVVTSSPVALEYQGEVGNSAYAFYLRVHDEWMLASSRTCSGSCGDPTGTMVFTISQRGLFGTAPASHASGVDVIIDTGHYAFGWNPLAIGGTVITGGKEMMMPSRVVGMEINTQGAGPLADINGLFINSVSHEQAVEGSEGIYLARLGYWRTESATISGFGVMDVSAGGYPHKLAPGNSVLLNACSIPANDSDISDRSTAVLSSAVDASTDKITIAAPYFATNNPVRLTTTGTLPAGLSLATTYYVRDVTIVAPFSFKLSATPGGVAINITDAGTGTHTIVDYDTDPVYTVSTVSDGYHITVTPALAFNSGTCNITRMNDNTYNLPWNYGIWIEDGAAEVGLRLGQRTQFNAPLTDARSASTSQKITFGSYDGAGSARTSEVYATNIGYLWVKPGLQSDSLPTWSVLENNNNNTGSVGQGFSVIHSTEGTQVFKGGVYMARTGSYGRGDVCIAVDNTADTSNVDPATDRKVCVTAAGKFYFYGLQDGSAGLSTGGLYYDSGDSNRVKYVP